MTCSCSPDLMTPRPVQCIPAKTLFFFIKVHVSSFDSAKSMCWHLSESANADPKE